MQVLYPDRIGIWRCWSLRREEKWRTQRKTLGARGKLTASSTYILHWTRIQPGPHWWEVSTLTTAPSLLTNKLSDLVVENKEKE